MLFQLVQIIYWVALSIWFGGGLLIAMGWGVIFSTVEKSKPYLTEVLSVNLEGHHGTLLASTIVGNLINYFVRVQLLCAGLLIVTTFMQFFLVDLHDTSILISSILRAALLVGAVTALLYHWRVLWPQIVKHRQEFLDHADEPDVANPALDQFNRFQKSSGLVLQITLFLLLTMLVFSVQVAPARVAVPVPPPAAHT